MERPPNPVTESIDGATGDITMSGDAMRWSPELAEGQARGVSSPGALPGVDVAAGFGALLGLDGPGVRRLVSGAVTSLATVAGDVVAELRQLTRGPEEDDEHGDGAHGDGAHGDGAHGGGALGDGAHHADEDGEDEDDEDDPGAPPTPPSAR